MARAQLTAREEELVAGLRVLENAAGWTHRQLAESLGVNLETVRGLIYYKNGFGPFVLARIAAFADRATPHRVGSETFFEAQRVGALARELLGPPSLEDLLDSLHRRVGTDFEDLRRLLEFTGVDPDEWQRFAAGAEPSAEFLETVAAAYSGEAAQIKAKHRADAEWCQQIATIATRAMDRVLT